MTPAQALALGVVIGMVVTVLVGTAVAAWLSWRIGSPDDGSGGR